MTIHGPQSATYLLCFCKLGPLHSTIIKLSKFGTHNLLRSLVLMRFSLLKPVSQTTELVTTHKDADEECGRSAAPTR